MGDASMGKRPAGANCFVHVLSRGRSERRPLAAGCPPRIYRAENFRFHLALLVAAFLLWCIRDASGDHLPLTDTQPPFHGTLRSPGRKGYACPVSLARGGPRAARSSLHCTLLLWLVLFFVGVPALLESTCSNVSASWIMGDDEVGVAPSHIRCHCRSGCAKGPAQWGIRVWVGCPDHTACSARS